MLNKKENQDTEFKQSWRDEYIKWVCGFANAKGGQIYIGVDDNGVVVGIDNTISLLESIPNKVRDILGIVVDLKMLIEDDKEYLEIQVESYPYPVSYKGQYHYRTGSSKQELKGAALDKFLLAKQGKRWDGVPVPYVGMDDLDTKAFNLFRQKALKKKRFEADILDESDAVLIEKLHLLDGDYLKRAALLLFHDDPEKFITGSFIKIGYFKSDSELIYHDSIHGSIIAQVDQCIDLLFTKYLKAYITYNGIQRVESFPISELAFREALINAVVHKDYAELTPIQISVYDDKLMIWNTGELPQNWTLETLMQKHASQPFNPVIANVFFLAGLIESWGRGIDKITQESESFNNITPKFRFDNGLWVEFDFNQADILSTNNGLVDGLVDGLVGGLVESQKQIVHLIAQNPNISKKEMSERIGISTTAIDKNIISLKNKKIIKRIGSDKAGEWVIINP